MDAALSSPVPNRKSPTPNGVGLFLLLVYTLDIAFRDGFPPINLEEI